MIRFQAVTKRYGVGRRRPAALVELDLRVERGECVALLGPNGAGKSTALGLALGYLRPTAGSVRLGGLAAPHYVRTRGAGYLPERFAPGERLPAGRAVGRLALLDGLPAPEARSRARRALARTGLDRSARRRVGELSRGNRKRLALAQLLLRPREVLLLDEPWAGLDPAGRALLRDLLRELRRRREGAAVLLASHDLDQVGRVADRAILLDGGRSVEELPLAGRVSGAELERRLLARGRPAERGAGPGTNPAGADAGGGRP